MRDRQLAALQEPLRIFDFDQRRVHWVNAAALKVWSALSIEELCARDLGRDTSESIARRLAQYRSDFVSHASVFHERWTPPPNGQPVSLDVSFSRFTREDGRMAMLCAGHAQVGDAPEALRSLEALLHTTVMISLFDLEGRRWTASLRHGKRFAPLRKHCNAIRATPTRTRR